MKYLKWWRYSIFLQAGLLTLAWGYLVVLLAIIEIHAEQTPLYAIVSIAIGLFTAGCLITLAWPLILASRLNSSPLKLSWNMILWLMFSIVQLPLGLLFSAFQLWCFWQINNQQD